jgi:hypothetical protein
MLSTTRSAKQLLQDDLAEHLTAAPAVRAVEEGAATTWVKEPVSNRAQENAPLRRLIRASFESVVKPPARSVESSAMSSTVAESADVRAWKRARHRRIWEAISAVAAGVLITIMFAEFCSILTG